MNEAKLMYTVHKTNATSAIDNSGKLTDALNDVHLSNILYLQTDAIFVSDLIWSVYLHRKFKSLCNFLLVKIVLTQCKPFLINWHTYTPTQLHINPYKFYAILAIICT